MLVRTTNEEMLRDANKGLRDYVHKLEGRLEESRKKFSTLTRDRAGETLSIRLQDYEEELKKANESNSFLRRCISKLEARLAREMQGEDGGNIGGTDEVPAGTKILQLEADLVTARGVIQSLKRKLCTAPERKVKDAVVKDSELSLRFAKLELDNKLLVARFDICVERNLALKDKAKALQCNLNKLTKQAELDKAKIGALEQEKETLQTLSTPKDREIALLTSKCSRLEQEFSVLTKGEVEQQLRLKDLLGVFAGAWVVNGNFFMPMTSEFASSIIQSSSVLSESQSLILQRQKVLRVSDIANEIGASKSATGRTAGRGVARLTKLGLVPNVEKGIITGITVVYGGVCHSALLRYSHGEAVKFLDDIINGAKWEIKDA